MFQTRVRGGGGWVGGEGWVGGRGAASKFRYKHEHNKNNLLCTTPPN